MANEVKVTERYKGLIEEARKEQKLHEDSGWRLANLVYDAVAELRAGGLVISETRDRGRMTATRRVAADMGWASWDTAYKYFHAWKRFADPAMRHEGLTFNDHLLVSRWPGRYGTKGAIEAVRGSRASQETGRVRTSNPVTKAVQPYRHLGNAMSFLRSFARGNVWDYPDSYEVLSRLYEIQELLTEQIERFEYITPRTRRRNQCLNSS